MTPRNPWKTVAIAACVIAVCAVTIAVLAVAINYERINDILGDRKAARITACLSYNNDLAAKVNKLNDRDQALLEQTFNPMGLVRAPDKQALVDRYLAQQKAQYEAVKVKPRDCTPAGIAAYYAKGKKP